MTLQSRKVRFTVCVFTIAMCLNLLLTSQTFCNIVVCSAYSLYSVGQVVLTVQLEEDYCQQKVNHNLPKLFYRKM